MKILLFEDDSDIVCIWTEYFMCLGHDVTSCLDVKTAQYEIYDSGFNNKYDIIIIDLMIPSSDEGMWLLEEVRKKSPKTSIIMVSVKSDKMTSIVSDAFKIGIHTFLDKDKKDFYERLYKSIKEVEIKMSNKIFISHGQNEVLKLKLKDFLRDRLDRETLILSEYPNRGLTVVEKLEKVSKLCNQAVVLLTKDDKQEDGQMRARQNVIHEIGFFQGKYGRENVILLCERDIDLFSNISGIVRIDFDANHFEEVFESLRANLNTDF